MCSFELFVVCESTCKSGTCESVSHQRWLIRGSPFVAESISLNQMKSSIGRERNGTYRLQ